MKRIHDFYHAKQTGRKIAMVTCYDYAQAQIANASDLDCLLVGDTAAMVMFGHQTTLPATVDLMCLLTEACVRGAPDKFIIADLPFMSYRLSSTQTREAVQRLMQAGAHAIKLEGATGNLEEIRYLVDSGVPVIGHLGLTPQSVHQLGGFRVQGRDEQQQEQILQQAIALEAAGCFAIVLECIPEKLSARITQALSIATIGIGAGAAVDGQVLVWHDLLGLQTALKPKFVKQYLNGQSMVLEALQAYVNEVRSATFPSDAHCYGE